mmetsp:Transcript_24768/g.62404  ORF Transcript_24768/g.62404 Transcript_24768/m.62404 type:complete len:251 (-) Transcript_24768:352-1104(-)
MHTYIHIRTSPPALLYASPCAKLGAVGPLAKHNLGGAAGRLKHLGGGAVGDEVAHVLATRARVVVAVGGLGADLVKADTAAATRGRQHLGGGAVGDEVARVLAAGARVVVAGAGGRRLLGRHHALHGWLRSRDHGLRGNLGGCRWGLVFGPVEGNLGGAAGLLKHTGGRAVGDKVARVLAARARVVVVGGVVLLEVGGGVHLAARSKSASLLSGQPPDILSRRPAPCPLLSSPPLLFAPVPAQRMRQSTP